MEYLPDNVWNNFIKKNKQGDIYDIAQGLVTTLILVMPQATIKTFQESSRYQLLRSEYYYLVRQNTNIKLASVEDITICFVSKEEFEAKYDGSWYNFFR